MKKLLAFLILLLVMGLAACGSSSTSSEDARDECSDNPDLCGTTPEPADDVGM